MLRHRRRKFHGVAGIARRHAALIVGPVSWLVQAENGFNFIDPLSDLLPDLITGHLSGQSKGRRIFFFAASFRPSK